ncbi:post-transcriptional regulator [Neobacillus sp. LXY-4]|uniref:post-transcriptional regulator n=1 Tax=Neobacillus sp. LXY-4 TaxID=3379826 RepID=UPI003EDFBE88
MVLNHEYDRFRELVNPVLKSKAEEFKILGYQEVTEQELWGYLTNKKWKKTKEEIRLYEIVQDILSVQIGQYMSYATVEAFKLPDFSFENEEDRQQLLK